MIAVGVFNHGNAVLCNTVHLVSSPVGAPPAASAGVTTLLLMILILVMKVTSSSSSVSPTPSVDSCLADSSGSVARIGAALARHAVVVFC